MFPCIFVPQGDVQLSASGPSTDFCRLALPLPWSSAGPAVIVRDVECYTLAGTPAASDNFFAAYTARA